MIGNHIHQEHNALKNLRAVEHVHTDEFIHLDSEGTVYDEQDFCYASRNIPDDMFEDLLTANPSDPRLHQTNTGQTIASSLSADSKISPDEYNDFYQAIADGAKEWTDKPSDKKKIKRSIEYVLNQAKKAPVVNNKLCDRLERVECFRIVEKLLAWVNKKY